MTMRLRNFILKNSTFHGRACLSLHWKNHEDCQVSNLVFELFTKLVILNSIVRPKNIGQYTERLAFFLDYLETGNEILKLHDPSSMATLHRHYYEYLTEGTGSEDLLVQSISKANKHKGFEKFLALRFISPANHLVRSSHALIEPLRNNLPLENEWDIYAGLSLLERLSYCYTENFDFYLKPRKSNSQLEPDYNLRNEGLAKYKALNHEFYPPGYIVERILNTSREEGLIWALIGAASQHRKDTIPDLILEILASTTDF
ncbi:hypothetical protein E8E95_14915 [Pseudomonas sp. BN414]|uniref:hypothetical protein n=1 Tax=Pseudomonas sp. BN414 TaxID=2567888 RepID=UPI0024566C62|nr:hypothetical protein [Pseudomonas sp. BN414]MDH4567972.1 hypothetical protein [Pseudomonas sp. BN414]